MANILQATEIREWERDAATVWWLPPNGEGAQLTVAHFEMGGPVYDDTLFRLGSLPGPLLLKLPSGLATALRRELDGHPEMRVGWMGVADEGLLALLHPNDAGEHRKDALMPHLDGHQTYVSATREQPRPKGDDLIAVFHNHCVLTTDMWQKVREKMLGRDYRRHLRACWSFGTPSVSAGMPTRPLVPGLPPLVFVGSCGSFLFSTGTVVNDYLA